MKLYLIMGVLSVACFVCLTANGRAQHQPISTAEDSLKTFLQSYLSDRRLGDDKPTRYSSAFVNLNEDPTKEVIVYLTGGGWWRQQRLYNVDTCSKGFFLSRNNQSHNYSAPDSHSFQKNEWLARYKCLGAGRRYTTRL